MEKYNIEINESRKGAILSGLDLLEMTLCDNNPNPKENELGIANTRAICNEIREQLNKK